MVAAERATRTRLIYRVVLCSADRVPAQVEINIGQDYAYHSIFVCPVTKELATEANPAVILPCGHMLCEETVAKLSKGNAYATANECSSLLMVLWFSPRLLGNPNNRFKCPYCPMEATRQAVKRVFM